MGRNDNSYLLTTKLSHCFWLKGRLLAVNVYYQIMGTMPLYIISA